MSANRKVKVKTELRKKFEKSKFSVNAYCQAIGVTPPMLSGVLDGIYNGKKNHRSGAVRVIIKELKDDGLWEDELPWEE